MAVYIVTYDLKEPGQRYDDLIAKIKNYGSWAKLGYSCFLINTNDNAVQVRDNLKLALDPNDKIYVGQATTPAAWSNMPEDVSNWIKSNL